MQFLAIKDTTTLSQLADLVGDRNVDSVLAANNLKRTPNIGKSFKKACDDAVTSAKDVNWQRQMTLLNTVTGCADVFETLALMGTYGWKLFSVLGTLPGMLKIPESIVLQDSVDVIGVAEGVNSLVYKKAMNSLKNPPHYVDPAIFNEYSSRKSSQILNYDESKPAADPFQWFKLPWGEVTLHSSLSGESMDIPVYPEEVSDGRSANYTTMPDLLYQYEPWQVYQSSGPRRNTYAFKFHRDMWSGDHTDGKANQLIRFCESNCYPEYNGSAVNTSTISLYIAGTCHITGVLQDVRVKWSGPLGLDGWYLVCELELTIIEVSDTALNYSSIRDKGVIG